MAFKLTMSLSKLRKKFDLTHPKTTAHNDIGSEIPSKSRKAAKDRRAHGDHKCNGVSKSSFSHHSDHPVSPDICLRRVPPRTSSLLPIRTPPPRTSSLPPKIVLRPLTPPKKLLPQPSLAPTSSPKSPSKSFARGDDTVRDFLSFSALYEQATSPHSIPLFFPPSTAMRTEIPSLFPPPTAQPILQHNSQEDSTNNLTRPSTCGDSSAPASSAPLWVAAGIRYECRQKDDQSSPVSPSPSAWSQGSASTAASVRMRRIADANVAAGNLWDLLDNTDYAASRRTTNPHIPTTYSEDFTTNYATECSQNIYRQHAVSLSTSDYPCIPYNPSGMSRITEVTETTTVSLILLSPLAERDDLDSLSDMSLTDVVSEAPTLGNLQDLDDDISDTMSLASVLSNKIQGFF